ncbi:MAG: ribosomal protein L11 methyltransferase [Betaproteobacteria bacterium]|nr:MAG: ribosomal protein L11 methyltransferase [Betaproteobacteria bacterium]
MAYTALSFVTDGPAADAWGDALLDAGALAVEATDAGAGTPEEVARFAEPGEPGFAAWPRSRLVALFDAAADAEAALAAAARALDRAAPAVQRRPVEERDWVRATQAQFGPVHIADDFHIVPSWSEPPAGGTVVRLDPGLAFGTGSHPTTLLCLQWLHLTLRRGDTLLDYGCGSGILAIAAARLGTSRVVGTDVDPQALAASHENAAANRVRARFVAPDDLGPGTFGVVVANILANPLRLLAPAIAARVAAGGRLALSGILEAQADDVIAAYAPWITLRAWRAAEGWVLLAGAR